MWETGEEDAFGSIFGWLTFAQRCVMFCLQANRVSQWNLTWNMFWCFLEMILTGSPCTLAVFTSWKVDPFFPTFSHIQNCTCNPREEQYISQLLHKVSVSIQTGRKKKFWKSLWKASYDFERYLHIFRLGNSFAIPTLSFLSPSVLLYEAKQTK